jgi:hypothetical protein
MGGSTSSHPTVRVIWPTHATQQHLKELDDIWHVTPGCQQVLRMASWFLSVWVSKSLRLRTQWKPTTRRKPARSEDRGTLELTTYATHADVSGLVDVKMCEKVQQVASTTRGPPSHSRACPIERPRHPKPPHPKGSCRRWTTLRWSPGSGRCSGSGCPGRGEHAGHAGYRASGHPSIRCAC